MALLSSVLLSSGVGSAQETFAKTLTGKTIAVDEQVFMKTLPGETIAAYVGVETGTMEDAASGVTEHGKYKACGIQIFVQMFDGHTITLEVKLRQRGDVSSSRSARNSTRVRRN